MDIETKSGFKCKFDPSGINDWEVCEILLGDGDVLQMARFTRAVMQRCMTPKDVDRLKAHVKTKEGRIPTDAMIAEVEEMVQLSSKGKNS